MAANIGILIIIPSILVVACFVAVVMRIKQQIGMISVLIQG
jgi:hypothetical protein